MKRPERDRVAGSNSIGRGEHAAKRRSSIRGRKSSRSTMTREATARFRLGSIPARSLSPRGIPGGGGLLLAPGRLSVGRGVGWGGGAERRVTRPFVNNLVKVANHSGYSSLGRCLSKALLESGKKLTGRLPVTLMLAYNVPRYFQLLPPPRRFLVTSTPILVETALNGGGGEGIPRVQKRWTRFFFLGWVRREDSIKVSNFFEGKFSFLSLTRKSII